MKIMPGYMLREIAGSWVAIPVGKLSGDRSYMLSLSESSALLWRLLEKGADSNELVEAILKDYAIDPGTAKADVDKFLSDLRKEDLLVEG